MSLEMISLLFISQATTSVRFCLEDLKVKQQRLKHAGGIVRKTRDMKSLYQSKISKTNTCGEYALTNNVIGL